MLQRIKKYRNRCKSRMAAMDKFTANETALLNVPLFSNGTFDVHIALNGFIDAMNNKIEGDPDPVSPISNIIKELENYVAILERGFKFNLKVTDMNYSFSDSDIDDSPPPKKISRLSDLKETEPPNEEKELEAALECYFNKLKVKLTKILFHSDHKGRSYCTNDVQRLAILREFIIRSRLNESEVIQFIKPPALVRPNVEPDNE